MGKASHVLTIDADDVIDIIEGGAHPLKEDVYDILVRYDKLEYWRPHIFALKGPFGTQVSFTST